MLLSVFLALAVIIATARVFGLLFGRLNQPAVIGEVIGGIALGPSLLGWLAPSLQATLLPAEAAPALGVIAQAGVIAYMFLIGLELDWSVVKGTIPATVPISIASVVVPFVFGALLAGPLFPSFAPTGVPFRSFQLFLGVSLAITAFPVLARILADRGMQKTRLGIMALTCAAINDALAWALLAFVISVMATASGASLVGTHSILAAFVVGAILPHDKVPARVIEAASRWVRILVMPAFFAVTGLRTEIGLVSSIQDWLICAGIVAVATAGKFGGTTLAARAAGLTWRNSAALGALMNTRGLVELIVLNIGLDLGVLSPRLFTMLVIMAIVTTMMTSPLLTALVRSDTGANGLATAG